MTRTYTNPGVIVRYANMTAGRLARGSPTAQVFEDVRVTCHKCGGVTIFPVLKDSRDRPTPAPCAHCGTDI